MNQPQKTPRKRPAKIKMPPALRSSGLGSDDQTTSKSEEWVELFPYGLAVGTLETRPVFLFRDESQDLVLPVWLKQKEAMDTLASAYGSTGSPHKGTEKIFGGLGIGIEKCQFTHLQGSTQFVELKLVQKEVPFIVKGRASDLLSLCLHQKAKFFAQKDFIHMSRNIDAKVFSEFSKNKSLNIVARKPTSYLN